MRHPFFTRSPGGFSILELVCALVIVVIFSAIAYPAYLNAITTARRAEAKSALHALMLQQERYYLTHNTYLAYDSETNDGTFKWWSGESAASSYYEIHASACPNKLLDQCVLLTAYPGTTKVRLHTDPICGNLMLDSANNKTYSVSKEPNTACW